MAASDAEQPMMPASDAEQPMMPCRGLPYLHRRLIIEPSGLAHPSALVDMLQGEHLGPSLELQPVVCLVSGDAWQAGSSKVLAALNDSAALTESCLLQALVGRTLPFSRPTRFRCSASAGGCHAV